MKPLLPHPIKIPLYDTESIVPQHVRLVAPPWFRWLLDVLCFVQWVLNWKALARWLVRTKNALMRAEGGLLFFTATESSLYSPWRSYEPPIPVCEHGNRVYCPECEKKDREGGCLK